MLRIECCGTAMLLLTVACNRPAQQPKKAAVPIPGGPQIATTVVTIRTTLQPGNKTTTSTIVIGTDLARAAEEIGTWRLFDFKQQRVVFVDDIAKTYRYESLQSLEQWHADAAVQPMSDGIPPAEYSVTGALRPILGVPATQAVVKLGAYQREIWFGVHPLIPPELFALMQASEMPAAAAPMARKVDDALLAVRGFPLLDHAELPFGKTKIVVDREVVSIARRNMPESLLVIPEEYREIKSEVRGPRPEASPKAPASNPPASSSPPHDQKTPEAGSQSSSTTRKDL